MLFEMQGPDGNTPTRFTVYQNRSLSCRGNQLFFFTLLCVSFTIALTFAWQGFWLIIPFTGLEMVALGFALYLCVNRLSRTETVTVSRNEVVVNVKQKNKMPLSYSFPKIRAWASVFSPTSRVQKNRLWLSASETKIEIGAFLNDDEKYRLARAINRAILR